MGKTAMNVLREDTIIDWVTSQLGIQKNDAAFFEHDGIKIVINVDSFENTIHLYPFVPLRIAGRRAATGSLSDVLVKGAVPRGILTAIRVPVTMSIESYWEFYNGIIDVAKRYDLRILGGDTDIAETGSLRADIVVFGFTAGKIANRWGAKPGDLLAVSGRVGLSAILYYYYRQSSVSCSITREMLEEYGWGQLPKPAEWLALKENVHAAIDNSDGLALSLHYLAEASGVKLIIDHIPLHPLAEECVPKERILDEVLYNSGEEYNFIFTIPAEEESTVAKLGFTVIGKVEEGRGVYFRDGIEIKRIGWVGGAGYDKRR
jgi:thiamine-monophosphate kinase